MAVIGGTLLAGAKALGVGAKALGAGALKVGTNLKGASAIEKIFFGAGVVGSVGEYRQERSEGTSAPVAAGKAVFNFAMFEMFPAVGIGLAGKDLVEGSISAVKPISDHNISLTRGMYSRGFGGNFQDSQPAYTMRQRGIQAINNNGINARSVMGNEARMYSRGHYE